MLGASFQLSFAAVLALMVVYEAWQRRAPDQDEAEPGPCWAGVALSAGVSATTLVASAATTPFAAFHFQTIPTYGVLANLVAVPLTSFLVMPAGMVGLLADAVRAGRAVLPGHGLGLRRRACGLPAPRGAAGRLGAGAPVARAGLALLAAGGLWLALWQRPWRWLGLVPCAAALVLVLASRPPDLLVDPALGMAAVRGGDGEVDADRVAPRPAGARSWLRHLGAAGRCRRRSPGVGPAARHRLRRVPAASSTWAAAKVSLAHVASRRRSRIAAGSTSSIARAGPEICRGGGAWSGRGRCARPAGSRSPGDGERLEVRTVAASRGDWPWSRASANV